MTRDTARIPFAPGITLEVDLDDLGDDDRRRPEDLVPGELRLLVDGQERSVTPEFADVLYAAIEAGELDVLGHLASTADAETVGGLSEVRLGSGGTAYAVRTPGGPAYLVDRDVAAVAAGRGL